MIPKRRHHRLQPRRRDHAIVDLDENGNRVLTVPVGPKLHTSVKGGRNYSLKGKREKKLNPSILLKNAGPSSNDAHWVDRKVTVPISPHLLTPHITRKLPKSKDDKENAGENSCNMTTFKV